MSDRRATPSIARLLAFLVAGVVLTAGPVLFYAWLVDFTWVFG